MVIAIDGPAGAGKSTVAKALAERLGFTYLDSGAMYRCVSLRALEEGVDPDDPDLLTPIAEDLVLTMEPGAIRVDGTDVTEAIRTTPVTIAASRVSVHPGVREALVARQRELVATGGWVAEGRDIGTVVCPDAPLKVFLTAEERERARRRAAETGDRVQDVLQDQRERDLRDRGRDHGALRVAEDAVELDTTGLTIEEIVDRLVATARQRGLDGLAGVERS